MLTAACAVATVASTAPSSAQDLVGWDGSNPFNCVLQQAGEGVEFQDPDADPFCVEYDKTHQNVTEGGLVAFLHLEPARVAAASPKCFYYQRDHWTSRVDQENEATETWNWDGSYFFDKARGIGGAYVENFTINNQTGDPTTVPGFPDRYRPFFGEGRGGVRNVGGVPVDPACVRKAQEEDVYAGGPPSGGGDGTQPGDGGSRGGTGDASDPGFSEESRDPTFTG